MLDLQQGVDRNNLSSFRRVYQRSTKSTGSRTEFNFWEEKRTKTYDNLADLESSQIEFQSATDDYSAYSPPFWASTRHEASTLLPKNHHYSFRSPTSRLQVITDSRRELMKMVQDMSEPNYELSLKDIVDDRISMQEVQQDVEKKIESKKNKSYKRRQMWRSESMDSGVFLLKMFMPACLCSKKKPAALGNRKKVSRMPSFDGSEKPVDKEWWGVRFLISRQNKNSCSSSSSSSGSTSCTSSRNADSSFTPSCCTSDNLCRSGRQRGCLF